ncbi:MAG: hypothetical protein CMQ17_10465 [Gammaproteobacteria bacterium]|jgi:hypothetical protein|nr:hypothetical protein [Gammaproteobacteria bacterium]HJO11842.1 hypothetical protein [Gammaproteobacteria bacterium]|tara:strand:+ start:1119 stop:1583 length:465 start_codon:yes stop_codon:yes gene_type:complete
MKKAFLCSHYKSESWRLRIVKIIFRMTPVLLLLFSSGLYAASPRINYLLSCSGCHRVDGASSPPNVPTLRGELGRMLSVPQMREYIVRVPGASQAPLSDSDLADVMNWILEEFNADTLPEGFRPLTADEVTRVRGNILADPLQYRIEFWGPYTD